MMAILINNHTTTSNTLYTYIYVYCLCKFVYYYYFLICDINGRCVLMSGRLRFGQRASLRLPIPLGGHQLKRLAPILNGRKRLHRLAHQRRQSRPQRHQLRQQRSYTYIPWEGADS